MSRNRINVSSNAGHNIVHDRGEPCMVVIDPATCMLRIPLIYIHKTRAQSRTGSPSLCQLFLNNRCRQGANCFQVHADLSIVLSLREEVGNLPYCCVTHGDADRLGIYPPDSPDDQDSHELPCTPSNGEDDKRMDHNSGESPGETQSTPSTPHYSMKDVVLYVPGCTMGFCNPPTYDGDNQAPYIPISRCSYTLALRRLLTENDLQNAPVIWTGENGNKMNLVLDASNSVLCRMHIVDRCLYAEECKFLHLCKEVALSNPHLIHSMGLHLDYMQINGSPRRPCVTYQPHHRMTSPSFHANVTCCNPVNPRMWQSTSDHSYSSFLTDNASRYKEQPPAMTQYLWNSNMGPSNTEGHPQGSGQNSTSPSGVLGSKRNNARRLLIPVGRCSEPTSDDATILPGILSLQTVAHHPCQQPPEILQPYSVDSCLDTNVASSFSTLMNDNVVMMLSDPVQGTNSSTSDSSKLSNQNGNKNGSYASLLNSSRTLTSDSPKPPLQSGEHTPSKRIEYISKSCPVHTKINFLDMDTTKSTTVDGVGITQQFHFKEHPKHQNLSLFEKSTSQQRSASCWQHNPYSGVMLDGINLFCKDSTAMSANV